VKVILDTNIIISAIFFGGLPRLIVEAWEDGRYKLIISQKIYKEYVRIAEGLVNRHPELSPPPILDFIAKNASFVEAPRFKKQDCEDPDDDIFLEAAVASGAKIIVSGDKLLLACDGYQGVNVMKARDFVENYL
jgi:uncharacterized protein